MRKRLCCIFMILCLVLSAWGAASAAGIKLPGRNEAKLYDLYSQVQSQLQLFRMGKASLYNIYPDYEDIERNPAAHKNEKIYVPGQIIQVLEGPEYTQYRIEMNGSGSRVFLMDYVRPENSERLLVDDQVWVYATFKELKTYKSTTNLSVTVPYCRADLIIRSVTDKSVLSASYQELEEALPLILEALRTAIPKDREYCKLTKNNYDAFARQDGLYKDAQITVSGTVLQSVEGSYQNTIRLAVDSDSDKVLYLKVDPALCTVRVLDDDKITVRGKYTGLYTYESTLGGEITIPSATAESLEIKGYKAPGKASKDKSGNYTVTKKTFDDYARRPTVHLNEPIAFSAKVLQVIEGNSVSAYRMAVDSDSDRVFYVEIANSDRTTRVLENDTVKVTGTFTGLMSYESTLGAPITVPECSASSIEVPGQKASASKSTGTGPLTITKKNYDSVAREGDANKGRPVSFTARVVQVVEDSDGTLYRLAVDKNSDAMVLGAIRSEDLSFRILEDDIVTVEGTSTGLYSYQSTMSGTITIPSCQITRYSVEGYRPADLGQADAAGYLTVTKAGYQELARNPDPYTGKKLRFRGKVVQVVEKNGGENIYRVAVDSDNDCVFYIEYTLPSGSPRILEKDTVNVTGTYFGIYTYSTLMGSSMSVPALIADTMKR